MNYKKLIASIVLGLLASSNAFAKEPTCWVEATNSIGELERLASRLVESGYKIVQFQENSRGAWILMACKQ